MTTGALDEELARLRPKLESIADPDRAANAARYMKDHFDFLGVAMQPLRVAAGPLIRAGRTADADQLLDTVDALWDEPEREFQYVGVDLLKRWHERLRSGDLGRIERLVRTKSWWDTVDALASHVVGGMVAAHRPLVATMDDWVDDPDIWIARTAILHQLRSRNATDADRLFGYVDRRSGDTEFFIRKACGWALREYAKTAPDAVREFVDARRDRLSGLTIREATKHL